MNSSQKIDEPKKTFIKIKQTPENLRRMSEIQKIENLQKIKTIDSMNTIRIKQTPENIRRMALLEEQIKRQERDRRMALLKSKMSERKEIRQNTSVLQNPTLEKLHNFLKNFLGKRIIVDYVVPKYSDELYNKTLLSDMENIPETWPVYGSWQDSNLIRSVFISMPKSLSAFQTKWEDSLKYSYQIVSDLFIFTCFALKTEYSDKPLSERDNLGKIFIRESDSTLTSERIKQAFADGVSNCLLTPIKQWAEECLMEAKSDSAKKRYKAKLNKLEKYLEKYTDGIPEDDLQEIATDLAIDITIQLPLLEHRLIEIKSSRRADKHFKYVNVRFNHVETIDKIITFDEVQSVSRKELENIKENLDKNNTFYIFKRDITGISQIIADGITYRLNNDYILATREFDKTYNFSQYKLDFIKEHELSRFVNDSVHYNGTIDFQDITELRYLAERSDLSNHVTAIDMKQAYANFKSCKFYNGFLGKIHDFRLVDNIKQQGLYYVNNFDFTKANSKLTELNNKLNIYKPYNIYPKPELEFLQTEGVNFEVCYGAIGSSFDFEFPKYMLKQKDKDGKIISGVDENGISYYAKWTGACNSIVEENNFYMKGNKKLAKTMRSVCKSEEIHFYGNDEIQIKHPKEYQPHLSQITSYITSYQRINVLEQLLNMDLSKVIRVCVDGIYTYEKNPRLYNVFVKKNEYRFGNDANKNGYCSRMRDEPEEYKPANYRKYFQKEVFLGAGGNGKTHHNIMDKGLIRPLYVTVSHKLCRDKASETGCKTEVLANVISSDTTKQEKIRNNYNCLIVDEISMMSENVKNIIFKLYPTLRLIFCGDLGYQLPPISSDDKEVEEMTTSGFDNIVYLTENRRFKDDNIKALCQYLRESIKNRINFNEVKNYIINRFTILKQRINQDRLMHLYDINDFILCRTNDKKDSFTKLFTGKFGNFEKYYCVENTRSYANGQIVISTEKPDCKSEIRHGFTTHSVQGITIDENYKLFIDIHNLIDFRYIDSFNLRILYTAISRAKRIDQIYIIA